ncbi:ABC transporter ATP-binding protein [Bacillus alkalicellulosilyticus]|uniref:ABC transporter ATP-binding protein n=1 Tax=Alkalihalobacterium alkalicellulosilyticum TaxID=1912214 RepID=UPI00148360E3|nr:ABC transporter ATP-binding protein [Bacillus alkalicellulosilyticus]
MLKVENITKKIRDRTVLHHINLQLAEGEVLGLIGPNGAGKTTLLSLLSTTMPLESGDITVDGLSVRNHVNEIRKKIGYVPQEIALYPTLTVFDNLSFWASMLQIKDKHKRIKDMVQLLHLKNVQNERIERLSGGYKRRVNIAVALMHEPSILLMDEPTVGMDLFSKQELLPFLKDLSKNGTSIIYTSHDVEELLYLSDRIAMLEEGKLVFNGSVKEAKQEITLLQGIN